MTILQKLREANTALRSLRRRVETATLTRGEALALIEEIEQAFVGVGEELTDAPPRFELTVVKGGRAS